MARKRTKPHTAVRESLHVTFPPDVLRRLRAYAGFSGKTVSDVLIEGALIAMRGFSARQDSGQNGVKLLDRSVQDAEATEEGESLRPDGRVGTEAA